jgi:hypothetical protein
MKVKAIIFGSTGMVGKGLLLECLDNPEVDSVLVINRSEVGLKHNKLKELVTKDFHQLQAHADLLKNYNACYFCLGVTVAGLTEAAYTQITYDLTLSVAHTLLQISKDFTFCYVSGSGTDSTEKGRMMWARVKGKTENALLAMPFRKAYMFRPGYIQPLKGIRSRTAWYNAIYTIFKPLYFLLKPFPGLVTNTVTFSKAMINVVSKGYEKNILESKDINKLGEL